MSYGRTNEAKRSGASFLSHHELDARRLLCPLPVIRTQNRAQDLKPGDTLEIICTDPGALYDIPAWCRMFGHEVINTQQTREEVRITLRVSAPSDQP